VITINIAAGPRNVFENPSIFYLPCYYRAVSEQVSKVDREAQEKVAADLRARIEAPPKLPFNDVYFTAKPPEIGWESGAVSWVAVDRKGPYL